MSEWPSPDTRAQELYRRAEKVMPGGVTRIVPWQPPYPPYAERGEGAYIIDVDGTRRLDLVNNFSSMIHGHAHPEIVRAVQDQVALGTAFSMPTPSEVDLAETISQRTPNIEWLRFSNSGSEAVMCAIKAARALTGRPKIVKIEGAYHGSYDFAEVSLDSTPANWGQEPQSVAYSAGVPDCVRENVVVVPFNDPDAAGRIIRGERDRIAGILIDVTPSYLGYVSMTEEFARTMQDLAREIGAALILDEVISYRMNHGGAQRLYGLEPDYTVLGKIIGGGFPIGAVGGPRSAMAVFDHRNGKPLLPWSGTFTANPISMVAGKVSLDLLTQQSIERINGLGETFRNGLSRILEETGYDAQVTGVASSFKISGHRRPISDYRSSYSTPIEHGRVARLQEELLQLGYYIAYRGHGFFTTVNTPDEVDGLLAACRTAISRI